MYPTQQNQYAQLQTTSSQYPSYYQYRTTLPMSGIVSMGLAGAVITGVAVTAKGLREVKDGNMTRADVVGDVLRESLGGGIATAVGAAAATSVARSGFLAVATMAAVSIGVKYLYDGMTGSCAVEALPAKTSKSGK